MKYCPNCNSAIDDNAIFCPNCGARANGDGPTVNFGMYGGGYGSPYGYGYEPFCDNKPSKLVAVLSFAFWQVALAVWFLCRRTRPGKARSAANGALSSICVSIPFIGAIVWLIWKDDPTKRDYANVAGISAIVGAGIYALLIILSIALSIAGYFGAELYFALPETPAAVIMSRLR